MLVLRKSSGDKHIETCHRCSLELLVSSGHPMASGGYPGLVPQLRPMAGSPTHGLAQGSWVQDLHDLLQPLPGLLQRIFGALGMFLTYLSISF